MPADGPVDKKTLDTLSASIDCGGDDDAMPRLIEAIYPDLKRLAHFQLAGERPDHTLNTTAVVHEAYLRLADRQKGFADHKHFLRAASAVMRHLLVDHARKKNAAKRGDGVAALPLEENRLVTEDDMVAVLALDNAMKEIAEIDPRLEKIIECRFFGGLTTADTAKALDMKVRTVERDWHRARGYLLRAMEPRDD